VLIAAFRGSLQSGESRRFNLFGLHFGQPEVEHLRMTSLGDKDGDKDVAWLDVAVYDSGGMRGIERIRNFNAQAQNLVNFDRTPPILCFKVTPSRNSIAMKAWPRSSPMSWMVQMLG
jgi:hypothetical protein